MSASGEVRFANSLNSLHGAFTAKTPPRDPILPWNDVFYKECVEEFQVFTIKIDFRNIFASGEVKFQNSLNSLRSFTTKKLPHDPSLPWNGVYFIKNEKKRSGHCSNDQRQFLQSPLLKIQSPCGEQRQLISTFSTLQSKEILYYFYKQNLK